MHHAAKLKVVEFLANEDVLYENDAYWDEGNFERPLTVDDVQFVGKNGEVYYEINMNDVFAWACADSETVTLDELIRGYQYVISRPAPLGKWGAWVEWVSQRRQSVPQMPVLLDIQRRIPEERLKVPWYDAYDIKCRSKLYDIRKAVSKGADMETIKQILEREEKSIFLTK